MNSKIFKFIVIILILLSGYLLSGKSFSNVAGNVVIIYPDEGETKIKPEEAGGIILPGADNIIYENLQTKKTTIKKVNILAEPEQPLNIISSKSTARSNAGPFSMMEDMTELLKEIKSGGDSQINQNRAGPSQLKQSQANQNLSTAKDDYDLEVIMPKKIVAEVENDDTGAATNIEKEYLSTNELPQNNYISPESQEKNPREALNIVKITQKSSKLEPAKLQGKNNLIKEVYKLQLASVKTEADGIKEWERIKKKHQKILKNSSMTLKRVKHPKGQFFYLVLAGNYHTASQAKAVCKKLSNQQQNCIVSRN